MFGLGWSHLLLILLIVLLLGGWSKLPNLGESLGKGIRNFQKAMKGEEDKDGQDKKKDEPPKTN